MRFMSYKISISDRFRLETINRNDGIWNTDIPVLIEISRLIKLSCYLVDIE
jgi:hypothetical protein